MCRHLQAQLGDTIDRRRQPRRRQLRVAIVDLAQFVWTPAAVELVDDGRPPMDQHVCDTVEFRGAVPRNEVAYKWVDVDEALSVTQITRTYNANDSASATVQVSNVDDLPIDDTTVLYDQATQVGAIARAAG